MTRTEVFVSYCHADSEYLLRLKVHLRPYERQSSLVLWSDTKIRPGQQWREEIKGALDRAAVAILLVSADFLASDFVAENELPPLLEAAKQDGLRVFVVILKPCAFKAAESIAIYQAVNDPAKPVIAMTEAEREAVWVRLAEEVQTTVLEVRQRARADSATVTRQQPTFKEFMWSHELIKEEIRNPQRVRDFIVYKYEHIDLLEFMPLAASILQELSNAEDILREVRVRFARAGWEGDGEIQIMWLPPFVGAGVEDTWGVVVWFVKQQNNGTAFMASPVPLPFSRLLGQQ